MSPKTFLFKEGMVFIPKFKAVLWKKDSYIPKILYMVL